jgi:ABC-2 type transport system ATP-binding protein
LYEEGKCRPSAIALRVIFSERGLMSGNGLKVEIADVSKCYKGDVWALRDLSICIGSGVLGLLGPNGAGKSTLMRMIATITRPTSGRILWSGRDIADHPNSIRVDLGYLPQDFGVYPHLSALEFLTYLAAARGITGREARTRINQLLDLVNLSDVRKRRLGSFSGGMKQRVGIAQALLNDPKILIVDEPTAGLDPEERVRFRNLLTELAGERVVILSTHIVSDVEAVATHIAIINRGQLITYSSPEELLKAVAGRVWEVTIPSAALPELRATQLICGTARTSEGVRVRIVSDSTPDLPAKALSPSLEDAYMYLLHQHRTNGRSE